MKNYRALFELIKINARSAGRCSLLLLLMSLMFCAFLTSPCNAAQPKVKQATEYEIKAAYIYNFVLFVQWPEPNTPPQPADKSETFTIGIIGKDPFGNSFKDVEGKLVRYKKKKLLIKRYGDYGKNIDFKNCQILFISSSEKENLKTILAQVKGKPILTIAESSDFLNLGGMVRFVEKQKKIRWEINQTPVKRANLKFNSQLLRNAVRVVQIPKLPQRNNPNSSVDEENSSDTKTNDEPLAEKGN